MRENNFEGAAFCLPGARSEVDILPVRNLRSSIAIAAVLATAHAFGTLPVSQTSAPQTAEVKEQQETVNLAISGMT
jgi:hypothetical protein